MCHTVSEVGVQVVIATTWGQHVAQILLLHMDSLALLQSARKGK
jgi:hypothetical protein